MRNLPSKPAFTQNQTHLQMVDNRLNGLRTNNPDSAEIQRMEAAREDILSRMADCEQADYIKLTTIQLTPKEIAAQAEADRIAMEANRDKPSI